MALKGTTEGDFSLFGCLYNTLTSGGLKEQPEETSYQDQRENILVGVFWGIMRIR